MIRGRKDNVMLTNYRIHEYRLFSCASLVGTFDGPRINNHLDDFSTLLNLDKILQSYTNNIF
jgi:hypothetical protein